jgi:hypothetical protein
MSLFFNKEEEYTSPVCRVYSVNFENLMQSSSPSSADDSEEEDWGNLG